MLQTHWTKVIREEMITFKIPNYSENSSNGQNANLESRLTGVGDLESAVRGKQKNQDNLVEILKVTS